MSSEEGWYQQGTLRVTRNVWAEEASQQSVLGNGEVRMQTRARDLSGTLKTNATCRFTGPPEGGPNNEADQLAVLKEMLAAHKNGIQKIDGLALAVLEAPSGTEIINKFSNAGIQPLRLAYIGTDNYAMGAELGRVLLQVKDNDDSLAAGASFVIVGAGSPNIASRMQGVRDVLTTVGWTEVSTSRRSANVRAG